MQISEEANKLLHDARLFIAEREMKSAQARAESARIEQELKATIAAMQEQIDKNNRLFEPAVDIEPPVFEPPIEDFDRSNLNGPDAEAIKLPMDADFAAVKQAVDSGRDVLFPAGYVLDLPPNDSIWLNHSGTEDNVRYIGVYGEGPRPRLNSTGGAPVFHCITGHDPNSVLSKPVNYMTLEGLEIYFPAHDPANPAYDERFNNKGSMGIRWIRGGTGIRFIDLHVHHFWQGITVAGDRDKPSGPLGSFSLEKCIVDHNWSNDIDRDVGLYVSPDKGGFTNIEDCVFFENGWRKENPLSRLTTQSHNIYIDDGYTRYRPGEGPAGPARIVGNFIAYGAATGMKLHCGGKIQNNIFWRNAEGFLFSGNNTTVEGNIVLEGMDMHPNAPTHPGFWRRGTGCYTTRSDQTPRMKQVIFRNNRVVRRLGHGGGAVALDADRVVAENNCVADWPFKFFDAELKNIYTRGFKFLDLKDEREKELVDENNITLTSMNDVQKPDDGIEDSWVEQALTRDRGQHLTPSIVEVAARLLASFSPLPQ